MSQIFKASDNPIVLKRIFESGIEKILSGEELYAKEMLEVYDACFKICVFQKEQYVYDKIKSLVNNYCKTVKFIIDSVYNYDILDVVRDEMTMLSKDI